MNLMLCKTAGNFLRNSSALVRNNLTKNSCAILKLDDRFQNAKYCSKSFSLKESKGPVPHSFVNHFKLERLWIVGMIPIFPAALFIHNPVMDYLLAVAITMHVYWGFDTVMMDYKDILPIGDGLKKASPYFIYAVTIILFAGLMHFNYSDVGITKAFELIWTL